MNRFLGYIIEIVVLWFAVCVFIGLFIPDAVNAMPDTPITDLTILGFACCLWLFVKGAAGTIRWVLWDVGNR